MVRFHFSTSNVKEKHFSTKTLRVIFVSCVDAHLRQLHDETSFPLSGSLTSNKRFTWTQIHMLPDIKIHRVPAFWLVATCVSQEKLCRYVLTVSFTTDEWREFCCLHKYSCCFSKSCGVFFWWIPCLFHKWTDVLKEPNTGCYIWNSERCIPYTTHGSILPSGIKKSILNIFQPNFPFWILKGTYSRH